MGSTVGSVTVALRLAEQVSLSRLEFRISGNNIALTGDIAVDNEAATASAFVSNIAAGSGYRVALGGLATDGTTSCEGDGRFDVQTGQTSLVDVLIQCRQLSTTGAVIVGAIINNCPRLTSLATTRSTAPVGGVVGLRVAAVDADVGDRLTYDWTGSSGTFTSRTSPQTNFTCTAPGIFTLTATASDGSCREMGTVTVACLFPACGNDVVDPGEDCDPPGRGTCDSTCRRIAVCGNAVVEAPEGCDPPDGIGCGSRCEVLPQAPDASPGSVGVDAGTDPDAAGAAPDGPAGAG